MLVTCTHTSVDIVRGGRIYVCALASLLGWREIACQHGTVESADQASSHHSITTCKTAGVPGMLEHFNMYTPTHAHETLMLNGVFICLLTFL